VIPQDDWKSRPVAGSVNAGKSTLGELTDVHAAEADVAIVDTARPVADSIGLLCGKHLSQVVLVPSSTL